LSASGPDGTFDSSVIYAGRMKKKM
jgi:hypothetical protein